MNINEHDNPPLIHTKRLWIKPLTHEQILLYIQNDGSLEKNMGLEYMPRHISTELKEALENSMLPNLADPSKNYLYSTLWTIVSKADNIMVGDFCIVGDPGAEGEVELGYGMYEPFRKNGYMTEAVGGMLRWAARQAEIISIYAATDKDNAASHGILEKNGFVKVDESETGFDWRVRL